jgi:transcription initiation factor TFIIH subunit 3
MNAVDATSRAVEADTGAPSSLLTVILDTNPHAWNLLSPSLPLHKALASLLVFLNAHLAINPANQVAVLASHVERAEWLYPTPPSTSHSTKSNGGDISMANGGPVQLPPDDANKYRPFAAVERAITTNLQTLLATTTPTALASTPTTMTAGALTLALSHTSKLLATGPTSTQTAQTSFNYSDPNSSSTSDARSGANAALGSSTSRILILSASPDNSAQYIPTMNAIFAAQRLSIPIDVLTLASSSTFLQQAADATGGIHLARTTPASHAGLLQTLMLAFLPDPTARQNLIVPAQASGANGGGVDFRAACFCHRRIVDVGFVCSICLSIFCEPVPDGTCLTCGSHLALSSYGRKPAVVPRPKKKKKKRVMEGNGVETPGSAGGTPVPV